MALTKARLLKHDSPPFTRVKRPFSEQLSEFQGILGASLSELHTTYTMRKSDSRSNYRSDSPQRARRGILMPRGEHCRETIFAAQLPRNYPHRGGIFERGKNVLYCGGEAIRELSGTKIASQNRSDHGGRRQARNHFAAEIAGFSASPAAKKSLAASDFGMQPQLVFKIAAKSPVLKGRDFLHPILAPSYRSQTSS